MKTSANHDAFAHPSVALNSDETESGSAGLSKREYFASSALQGLAADSDYNPGTPLEVARMAVKLADELIAALNEKR